MRIGVLGTGDVGRTLSSAWVELGHEVTMGSRQKGNETARQWAESAGPRASAGSFDEAATFGEIVVLATLGTAFDAVIQSAGIDSFRDKLVIDTTNPLDFSQGIPPTLALSGNDSAGERIQSILSESFVVKAFNTVGHLHMFRPNFPAGPPDMFICGDSKEAKESVSGFLQDFGWRTVDIGGIDRSRYLEAMCVVWVSYAFLSDPPTWNHAFKLLQQ